MEHDKLNVGSGKTYLHGYLNVDINSKFSPDLVADMTEIDFPKNSFTEILAKDCIDHVSPPKTRKLLRYFRNWLKDGGELKIHLPNLDYLAEVLYKSENPALRKEALKWLYGTAGEGTTDYDTNHIRWCYNKKSISEMLNDIGFKVTGFQVDCLGFGMSVIARKKE